MPHVTFVPLTGFRIENGALREAGLRLPGLRKRAAAIGQLPALGLLTLAGLTPQRWSCSYIEADGDDVEQLADRIASQRPDLVAISALTASASRSYRLSERLRRMGFRTVLGGLHATTCSAEAGPWFDAVVIGDGEPVWRQLLEDVEDNAVRPFYRAGGYELAQAPLPRFDLLGKRSRPRFTLQTQRGCPLACEFCGASRLLGPLREKAASTIRRELDAIRTIDPRPVVELADDNTFAGRRDPQELFRVLSESGVRYFTECDWRIGRRPDVLDGLAASGCVQVLVGIESLDRQYRGMGAKNAEWPLIMESLAAIQETGVAVIGCFVVGADGQRPEAIARLADFMDGCELADVQVTVQTPFPGTSLRHDLASAGRLLPQRGWDHYTLFDVVYRPDSMSVTELESSFLELLRWTYRREATERREAIRRKVWRNHPRRHELASLRWSDTSSGTARPF